MSAEAGNWFVGWPIDARPWLAALTPPPRGARLFHPDDVHATVAFLGTCGEARARATWELVLAAGWDGATIAPGPVIGFGDPRHPSAWSVEPRDRAPDLAAYIARHRDAWLAAAGAPRDLRPPRPHVTLARPQRGASPDEQRALAAWAAAQRLPDVGLAVPRVALFAWAADRRERLFRIVESLSTPTA